MRFRTLAGGILAAALLVSPAALGSERTTERSISMGDWEIPLPGPSGGRREADRGMQLAQVSDPRIPALEEQVRSLNGTIEELNFQILQMQEQLRKIQEDNEFRFQEIEKQRSDAGAGSPSPRVAETLPARDPAAELSTEAPETSASRLPPVENGTAAAGTQGTLGTITFDADGNVSGGNVGDQTRAGTPEGSGSIVSPDSSVVAALPASDDPEELYRNAYEFILSGDYETAETGFRDHISRFPSDNRAADANFWLGEALLGQKKYRDAAEVFLAANKQYPSAKKAPDMMLKLGVALAGLNQRDVACVTFGEIGKRYPQASGALKERVSQEQALAAC